MTEGLEGRDMRSIYTVINSKTQTCAGALSLTHAIINTNTNINTKGQTKTYKHDLAYTQTQKRRRCFLLLAVFSCEIRIKENARNVTWMISYSSKKRNCNWRQRDFQNTAISKVESESKIGDWNPVPLYLTDLTINRKNNIKIVFSGSELV